VTRPRPGDNRAFVPVGRARSGARRLLAVDTCGRAVEPLANRAPGRKPSGVGRQRQRPGRMRSSVSADHRLRRPWM